MSNGAVGFRQPKGMNQSALLMMIGIFGTGSGEPSTFGVLIFDITHTIFLHVGVNSNLSKRRVKTTSETRQFDVSSGSNGDQDVDILISSSENLNPLYHKVSSRVPMRKKWI